MSFLTASSKEQYGLRLALRLAGSYYTKQPISLAAVADKERISAKYLEELVVPFKNSHLVKAVAGRSGGYVFTKSPKRVSAKDIIWLINKSPSVTVCVDKNFYCPLAGACAAKDVWQTVQSQVEKTLADMTLDKLIKNLENEK